MALTLRAAASKDVAKSSEAGSNQTFMGGMSGSKVCRSFSSAGNKAEICATYQHETTNLEIVARPATGKAAEVRGVLP